MDTLAEFVTSIDARSDGREMSNNLHGDGVFLEQLAEDQRKMKRPGMESQDLDLEAIGKINHYVINRESFL